MSDDSESGELEPEDVRRRDLRTLRSAGYVEAMETIRTLDFLPNGGPDDASELAHALRRLSLSAYTALLDAHLVYDETILVDPRQYRAFVTAVVEGNVWPPKERPRPGERMAEVLVQARQRNRARGIVPD